MLAVRVSADSSLRSFGAFALATLALIGQSACAKDPSATDDGNTTTTNGTTTTDDTSESGMTETSTDTDDDPTSTSASSGGFYAGPEPDWGSSSDCDPWAQDCPEGEKCVPYASTGGTWDANKCVPVTNDGEPGDACLSGGVVEANDDCDATSVCWSVDEIDGQSVGVCTPFCTGTPDTPSCAEGTSCMIANEGSINLCLDECDPVAQDCPEGDGCFWVESSRFLCLYTTADLMPGEACGFSNDCAPGSYCAAAALVPECAGSACCTQYCSIAAPNCPTPGTECVTFFDGEPLPGYEDVGLCVVPG